MPNINNNEDFSENNFTNNCNTLGNIVDSLF